MATVVKVKGCPKCGGDLYGERDSYGAYVACLQCGLTSEPKIYNAPEPVKEWYRKEVKERCKHHPDAEVFNNDLQLCINCYNSQLRANRKGRKPMSYGVQGVIWCSREGCEEPAETKGLCGPHYKASLKKPCTCEGCETTEYAKKLCHKHYRQMLKEQEVLV